MLDKSLSFSKGDGNILQILKTKWWKYLLMGLVDVEANYAVVKAYQFTTLTSIQVRENQSGFIPLFKHEYVVPPMA